MTDFGAANNTNTGSGRGSAFCYMSTGVLPEAGSLDSMSAWITDQGSADDFRFAVYQGGTDETPEGATLVWDSGRITDAPASSAFNTVAAGGQALAAGRIWLCVQTDASSPTNSVNSADAGDLDLRVMNWSPSQGFLSGGFPATAPAADGATSFSQAVKAFISYTAGGGGSNLLQKMMQMNQFNGGSL